jgi:hypothetical protein
MASDGRMKVVATAGTRQSSCWEDRRVFNASYTGNDFEVNPTLRNDMIGLRLKDGDSREHQL